MAQLMPLPLTVSCFSKIQIGFIFLVPAHPGSPGKGAVKRVCVCVCVYKLYICVICGSIAGLTTDVADSYIKISACLMQLATADSSNLDKYEFAVFSFRHFQFQF